MQPTGARLLCQHLHLGREGVGESRRRAERERESNDSSRSVNVDHISQRPHQSEGKRKVWQRANAKQREMERTKDKKTDRGKDGQGGEHGTSFSSRDPSAVVWLSVTQPEQSGIVGERVHFYATINSLCRYYINSDNISQEMCVCPQTPTSQRVHFGRFLLFQ